MRTAILAIAALGLAGVIASANAAPAQQAQAQTRQNAQNACPAGYFWEAAHYDDHMQLWPTGCVPNGR
jgi:hypothetical protein